MMKYSIFSLIFSILFIASCSENSDLASIQDGKSGSITRFVTHNNYMYALNPNQIITYSLENPEKPNKENVLTTEYGLETIIIYDNTIYVGSRNALYILGLDDPAKPELLSRAGREGLRFFGGCDPVVVKGNYAYSTIKIVENLCGIFNAESVLIVYDVSNKEEPQLINNYPLEEPNGLAYKGNHLLVCDKGADELIVFDITDPTNLLRLDEYNVTIDDPVDLIINENTMIVSTENDFEIFDVEDITSISQIGTIPK